MEDKSKSFYEFLKDNANTKTSQTSNETSVKPIYKALAWIVIFIANSLLLQFCWNFGIKNIFNIPTISFIQSVMVYTFARILTRGMFTVQ